VNARSSSVRLNTGSGHHTHSIAGEGRGDPDRCRGAGTSPASKPRQRLAPTGRSLTHHAASRNRSILTDHKGPGRPQRAAMYSAAPASKESKRWSPIRAGSSTMRSSADAPVLVGAADELEEDAQSRLPHPRCLRWPRRSRPRSTLVQSARGSRPEWRSVRAPWRSVDRRDRLGGVAADPTNVAVRQDGAGQRDALTPQWRAARSTVHRSLDPTSPTYEHHARMSIGANLPHAGQQQRFGARVASRLPCHLKPQYPVWRTSRWR